jgi:hypothetical protein
MKEVAELKRQVAMDSSRRTKTLSQAPQDQADENKPQTASSTSEMAQKPTNPKASRRHQTRKGDGDPSSNGDSSDSHERRLEKAARTFAARGEHIEIGVKTFLVIMTTSQPRAKSCRQRPRWKSTRQRFRTWRSKRPMTQCFRLPVRPGFACVDSIHYHGQKHVEHYRTHLLVTQPQCMRLWRTYRR